MPTFDCAVIVDATWGCSIQADTPEQAADLAEEMAAEEGVASLCHFCSNHLDTGDAVGVIVSNGDGEQVLDTDFRTEQVVKLTEENAKLKKELVKLKAELLITCLDDDIALLPLLPREQVEKLKRLLSFNQP